MRQGTHKGQGREGTQGCQRTQGRDGRQGIQEGQEHSGDRGQGGQQKQGRQGGGQGGMGRSRETWGSGVLEGSGEAERSGEAGRSGEKGGQGKRRVSVDKVGQGRQGSRFLGLIRHLIVLLELFGKNYALVLRDQCRKKAVLLS